jgi:hypothetical protein
MRLRAHENKTGKFVQVVTYSACNKQIRKNEHVPLEFLCEFRDSSVLAQWPEIRTIVARTKKSRVKARLGPYIRQGRGTMP